MPRREFPNSVRLACKARATRSGVVFCEECGEPAKAWQFDHIKTDNQGGKNDLPNCKLLCLPCHAEKTRLEAPMQAKTRRMQAAHEGLNQPKQTIQSRDFVKKIRAPKIPIPARRRMFA